MWLTLVRNRAQKTPLINELNGNRYHYFSKFSKVELRNKLGVMICQDNLKI